MLLLHDPTAIPSSLPPFESGALHTGTILSIILGTRFCVDVFFNIPGLFFLLRACYGGDNSVSRLAVFTAYTMVGCLLVAATRPWNEAVRQQDAVN